MSMHPERNYFAEYKNGYNYFVETGSWRGDGIAAAFNAGFLDIRSIDIDKSCRDFCMNRFDLYSTFKNISLFVGDSATELWSMIEDINEPIMFWLDSHWQMFENTERGDNPFPLLKELEQIAKHPIKTHTIIIDDMLIMQKNITGYDSWDIIRRLMEINIDYKIEFLPNPIINNILIAHV